jgi:hypothetical protein
MVNPRSGEIGRRRRDIPGGPSRPAPACRAASQTGGRPPHSPRRVAGATSPSEWCSRPHSRADGSRAVRPARSTHRRSIVPARTACAHRACWPAPLLPKPLGNYLTMHMAVAALMPISVAIARNGAPCSCNRRTFPRSTTSREQVRGQFRHAMARCLGTACLERSRRTVGRGPRRGG